MKSNHYKKVIAVIIGVSVFIALGVIFKLFIIGEPVDYAQVYCSATVNDQNLDLRIESVESAVALRGWKFEQVDNTLSIRARKVLVSPLFKEGDYETVIDLESTEKVFFGGQMIWSNAD